MRYRLSARDAQLVANNFLTSKQHCKPNNTVNWPFINQDRNGYKIFPIPHAYNKIKKHWCTKAYEK